jgi:hypothetical protein
MTRWPSVSCCSSRSQTVTSAERSGGRLLVEQPGVRLRHAELAAVYLTALADPARHEAATEALGELGRAVGLRRLGERIASPGDR